MKLRCRSQYFVLTAAFRGSVLSLILQTLKVGLRKEISQAPDTKGEERRGNLSRVQREAHISLFWAETCPPRALLPPPASGSLEKPWVRPPGGEVVISFPFPPDDGEPLSKQQRGPGQGHGGTCGLPHGGGDSGGRRPAGAKDRPPPELWASCFPKPGPVGRRKTAEGRWARTPGAL